MSNPSPAASPTSRFRQNFALWLVNLLVISVCVGWSVPGINESHYLPKAKHAWDSGFAPGDLFLDSHDSHVLATGLSGFLSQFLPLAAVACVGRLLSWSLFAWAWLRLAGCLSLPNWLSPISLAAWYFAVYFGHWAGEWAIGGFEAKSIAYPLILLGVVALLEDRWPAVWLWMAAAVAWHPVVGGWAGLTAGLIWMIEVRAGRSSIASQLPWLAAGTAIGLLGVVPALSGLGGPDRDGNVVAAQIQVFYRLTHHMCPRTFAPERHWAALVSLGVLLLVTWQWRSKRIARTQADESSPNQLANRRTGRLLQIAWFSVAFAAIGLVIDVVLASRSFFIYQPLLAAKLLRFYWFRWADVAVPLASTSLAWLWFMSLAGPGNAPSKERLVASNAVGFRALPLVLAVAVVVSCIVWRSAQNWGESHAPADHLVVQSVGPHSVETDRYVDWLAVCHWIRDNTPRDSLWLTPKYQQSFKWHAERAEVVCWKDVPQDNKSIVQWYRRVEACQPPRDDQGVRRGRTTEEFVKLGRELEFRWLLVDRTVQVEPPGLEIMYPIDIENRSFAVFRIPPAMVE